MRVKLLREVEVVVEELPVVPGADGAAVLPTDEPAADGTGAEAIGETDSGEAEVAADDQCDGAVEDCE